MIVEIINPSDKCTMEHEDTKALIFANCLLSSGTYGLEQVDGDRSFKMPIMLFGINENFFIEHTGLLCEKFIESSYVNLRKKTADALDSFVYGTARDREFFKELSPQLQEKWQDEHRSSMNNLHQKAKEWARVLRDEKETTGGEAS